MHCVQSPWVWIPLKTWKTFFGLYFTIAWIAVHCASGHIFISLLSLLHQRFRDFRWVTTWLYTYLYWLSRRVREENIWLAGLCAMTESQIFSIWPSLSPSIAFLLCYYILLNLIWKLQKQIVVNIQWMMNCARATCKWIRWHVWGQTAFSGPAQSCYSYCLAHANSWIRVW